MKKRTLIALACVLLLSLGTANAQPGQCNAPSFNSPPSFDTGPNPSAVTVGDLNADGFQDLVIPNLTAATVSILLGDGLGAFLPPVSYEVGISNNAGIYARDAAIADLNSDGKPDLVVVGGYNHGWVSVLLGNGDGSFGAAVSQLTGNATLASVVVGDFNGDTKKDVAVAATDSNKIHFLLGNGGGGFSSTLQVAVAANADEIAVGDLNGDGLSDVVTIHTYPTWGLTSVLGNSSGAFVVNQSIATRSQPQSIVLADLNEDSKLDLAMSFGWADHGIEFRLGDGAGNFGPSTEILTVFEALSLITADVNNDDNLDLIVQLSSASAIEVFLGNGNAGFTRSRSYGTLPDASLALASADFNEDGKADVVSLNAGASAVALLVGDGLGGFATPNVMVAQNQRGPRIVTGDFNGDNRPDVAIPREFANQVMVYLTDAAGRLQAPMFYSTNRPARSVATGDFNHDGKLDLALGTDVGAISILLGNGLGGFTGPTVFNVAVVNIPIVVTLVGKFDGDNHDDLIALQDTSFSGTGTFLLRGDGVGNFGAPSPVNLGEPTTWVAAADFNGDGKLDLALANGFPPQVKILHGDGTGTFTPSGSQYPIPKRAFHLLALDLTKDGRPDLVMTNNDSSPGNVAVMISTGAGFGPAVTIDSTLAPLFITTADFNSDSNPDLAISTHSYLGNIALMSGDGLGNFASPKYFTAGGNAGQIATADFNSDAKPDLVSSNYAAILLNTFTSLPCLSINDVSVTEGDNGTVVAEFTVGLSASSAETVRVNYVVKPVTAISGVDFSRLSGRLSFAPGETSKTISVPVTADLLDEFDETFKVQLSNPAHAGISDGEGEGTIVDNDPPPALRINDITHTEGGFSFTRNFTVTVAAPSGKAITVQYATANGTATAGTQVDLNDYFNITGTLTIPAGQTTGTIGVNVFGDDLFEPDETYFLNLSNPTNSTIEDTQGQGTILNDDPIPTLTFNGAFVEEGNSGEKNAVSQVFLSNPSYLPISFDFATADQTAEAGKDYVATSGTLTISAGARSGSLSVPIIGDTLDEVHETFLLNISNVQNATLTAPPVSVLIIDDDGPAISISDVSVKEGNSGLTNANFTLTLSAASPQQITVRVTTAPGTATSVNDYSFFNLNVSIPAGSVTRTVAIGIIGDTVIEPDETFFVNLTQPVSGTIADAQGIGTILNDDANIQLSAASYTANESGGSVQVAFNRAGDTSVAASVSYATSDTAALTECNVINSVASSRCDYATSIGTVNFAPGEASKNIFIPLVNDGYAEGNETFSITLSNAVGATLGSFSTANVTIQDNESVNGANPLDQVDFFIEQHYIDFLGRNPEPAGLEGWRNVLNNCGVTVAPPCDRIEVSAGFFRSPEFQARGYFIYRFYSSVGAIPLYEQFMPDFAKVSGFLSDAQLEANKVAFVNEFMARPVFQNKYSSTFSNPTAYVDALLQTVGLPNHPSRTTWINQLTASNTSQTRGEVLRALVESQQVYDKYYNEAFVIMQYFGYLRRTADASYLDWINTMNQTGGDYRIMINGFMNSAEYRRRFGP